MCYFTVLISSLLFYNVENSPIKKNPGIKLLTGTGTVPVFAAAALVLVLVVNVVAVAAGDHRQLGVCQRGLAGVQLPEGAVPIPHTVDQPGGSVAHLMNQCVPQAVWQEGGRKVTRERKEETRGEWEREEGWERERKDGRERGRMG
jgi:hypothetical protein